MTEYAVILSVAKDLRLNHTIQFTSALTVVERSEIFP
jgi:hypothetical protein